MITAAILITSLLVAPQAVRVRSDSTGDLREVLVKESWAHEVKLGRVAVERRVLTFCAGGIVRERIVDDTGIHDSEGTWALDQSGTTAMLVLAGEGLRERGRFRLRHLTDENAIELRFDGDDRYTRVFKNKRGAGAPCPTPTSRRVAESQRGAKPSTA